MRIQPTRSVLAGFARTSTLITSAVSVLIVSAGVAHVGVLGNCLIDDTGISGCTAGDVGVNQIEVTLLYDGCISLADTATVNMSLIVNAAQPTRYDIGLYLATDGGDALATGGSCFHEALFPVHPVGTTPTQTDRDSGFGPYLNVDGDSCGEVANSNTYTRFLVDSDVGGGSTTPAAVVINCSDTIDGTGAAVPNGYADVGWVVSWDQNAGGTCTSVAQAIPGSPSKCQAGRTDSSNSLNVPIGIPNLGLSLNCTPDQVGPGDTISCTVTYTNTGTGPADNIEYRIDFPDGLGTVSNVVTNGSDTWSSENGPTGGTTSDYISLIPGGGPTPAVGNVAPGTNQTMTFDFTLAGTVPDGFLDITVYTWFNNGISSSYQNQSATDTTTVTPAVVSSFETYRHNGQVLVEWETAAEAGAAAFVLERQNPLSGDWVRVSENLLPALLGQAGGGAYAYLDAEAPLGGVQTYRLIEYDFTGEHTVYGPYRRQPSNAVGRFADFDVVQTRGFARLANSPSSAQIASWDAKRESRSEAEQRIDASKASHPTGVVRIQTAHAGLTALSAAELAEKLGLSQSDMRQALSLGTFQIVGAGSPIPYIVSDTLSTVYFVAQAVDSRLTDLNTYFGSVSSRTDSGEVNLMTEAAIEVPSTPAEDQIFESTVRVEDNTYLLPYAVTDPNADVWFGGFVSTGYFGNTTYATTLATPFAADEGRATVTLTLQGLTDLAQGIDHRAFVRVNGHEVGDVFWDGVTPNRLSASFDQSILQSINVIEVFGKLGGGVEQSSFAVDTVSLTYQRHARTGSDMLTVDADGRSIVSVTGFSAGDIDVFDVTQPRRPIHVGANAVERIGAAYAVSFVPLSASGRYLAVRRDAAFRPVSIDIEQPSDLRSEDNASSYVVIAPASLREGAEALVDYRRDRFADASLVDLQDVYDEFSAGVDDPAAIKAFIGYAVDHWTVPPRYVVLAGKGTLDPMDYAGYGTNVLPIMLAPTPYGVYASDAALADVLGDDGVADVAIGRIPALSSADLLTYVDKLATFERGPLARTALMLADNGDGVGNFPADSLWVATQLPTDFKSLHVIQEGSDPMPTRTAIKDALASGVALFNYVGHGAPTLLGSEAFWTTDDVASMDTEQHPPVFAAFTCYVGNGTYPGLDSLTELMTLRAAGGVVAAIVPTGMSVNSRAVVMDGAFVDAFLGERQGVGEAVNTAAAHLHDQGGPTFMQQIYNVVGDPAISTRRISTNNDRY